MNLLEGIMQGVFGSPTAEMTAEEGAAVESKRAANRKKAGALAQSAMENPGETFMTADISGGDLLESIGSIMKFFQKGG